MMKYYAVVVNLVVQAENSVQAEVDVRALLAPLLERHAIRTFFMEDIDEAGDYVKDDERASS